MMHESNDDPPVAFLINDNCDYLNDRKNNSDVRDYGRKDSSSSKSSVRSKHSINAFEMEHMVASSSLDLEESPTSGDRGTSGDESNTVEVLFVKGELQPPEYKDVQFARLFYVQCIGVLVTAMVYAPSLLGAEENSAETGGETGVNETGKSDMSSSSASSSSSTLISWVLFVGMLFIFSLISSIVAFIAMMKFPKNVVQFSFMAAPALFLGFGILMFASAGSYYLLVWAIFFALVSACVYLSFKRFIPFASSTLHTALTAIQYNKGLFLVSLASLLVMYAWTFLWLTAVMGIFANADANGEILCSKIGLYPEDGYPYGSMCEKDPPNWFAVLLLVLAFYWTQQVIQNVMHCTTAGTVGSWWFSGLGDPSLFSQDVVDALRRALTYSFGSICFGSLMVAVMETLESVARSARHNRRGQLLALILECILHVLRRWLEYFNSWAFVYVGLYGYDYLTAGRNVMTLFQQRGWSSFIADRLVFRVLFFVQLAVGFASGGMAATVDVFFPMFIDDEGNVDNNNRNYDQYHTQTYNRENDNGVNSVLLASHCAAFFFGFIMGLILSSVTMFVLESAVRTVIVCFAESPAEFQEHHPSLCSEMRQGWAQAYPSVWNDTYESRFPQATVMDTQPELYHQQPQQQ